MSPLSLDHKLHEGRDHICLVRHCLPVLALGQECSRCSRTICCWMPPAVNKAPAWAPVMKPLVCGAPSPCLASGENTAAAPLLFGNWHERAGFAPHLCFPRKKTSPRQAEKTMGYMIPHIKGIKWEAEGWGCFLKIWILKSHLMP